MKWITKPVAVLCVFVCSLCLFTACGGGGGDDGNSGSANPQNVSVSGKIVGPPGAVARVQVHSTFASALSRIELVSPAYAQDGLQPLEGVSVDLVNSAGVVIATTVTDENGDFFFADVAAGTYSIVASSPNFDPLRVENIVVLDGDTVVLTGTVQETEAGVVDVSYRIATCEPVGTNQAQLGHAQNIADAASVPVETVIAERESSCRGWGELAQQFNVPPGTLGLGNIRSQGGGRRPNGDDDGSPGNSGNNNGNGNGNGNANGNSNGGDNDNQDNENDNDTDTDADNENENDNETGGQSGNGNGNQNGNRGNAAN